MFRLSIWVLDKGRAGINKYPGVLQDCVKRYRPLPGDQSQRSIVPDLTDTGSRLLKCQLEMAISCMGESMQQWTVGWRWSGPPSTVLSLHSVLPPAQCQVTTACPALTEIETNLKDQKGTSLARVHGWRNESHTTLGCDFRKSPHKRGAVQLHLRQGSQYHGEYCPERVYIDTHPRAACIFSGGWAPSL